MKYYITQAGRNLLEAMDADTANKEEARRAQTQHGRSTAISLAAGHQAAAEIASGQPEKAKISIKRGKKEIKVRGRQGSKQRKKYIRSGVRFVS